MQIKRFPSSPIHPLPEDYDTLTLEGQRQARVNASRLWLADTSSDPGQDAVDSLRFFDLHYLHPDHEADFDPLFYDMPPRVTPAFHWDMVRGWYTYRYNACIAPRGGAKSSCIRKDIIRNLVTSAAYGVVYATSTHDNAKHTGQLVREQVYNNQRIQDDFGPEFGGFLKPARGDKPTGNEYFFLQNGSYLRCLSAESRLRGIRPRRFKLDDPEYDEKASTSLALIRDYMEKLLFRICIPMTLRSKCGIDWIGTFVSRRHYLWHAMATSIDPSTGRLTSNDPRFNHWSRLWVRAAIVDPSTGAITSCWPDMWPATVAEKEAMGLKDAVSLEEMRSMMGTAAFNSEMLGKPGTTDDQFFKMDPSTRGRHSWWIEDGDSLYLTDPRTSTARICWMSPTGEKRSMLLSSFLTTAHLFTTVDSAFTESSTSDRRCCTLMAITPDNELFVLDMWSDRANDTVLISKTLDMVSRWKCPIVFVEVVRESFKLYQQFLSVVNTALSRDMGYTFVPKIKDLRPGTMEKSGKIATLEARFEYSLIKLPFHLRESRPSVRRLFDQIEGFNPEARDGGLEHDDELDTVAMSLQAIRGRFSRQQLPSEPEPFDAIAELRAGRKTMPGGASIVAGIPLNLLDHETISSMLAPDRFVPDSSLTPSETRV